MGDYGFYVYASVGIVLIVLIQQSWQSYRDFNRIKKEVQSREKINPKQKKRLFIAVGLLISTTLIVGFILLALNENIHLYYTPTQIANSEAPFNRPIRMGGIVVPGSVYRSERLDVKFDLTDGVNQVTVSYRGILPDLFREGQGIVATGQLTSDRKLVASQVLAKHDENYMPKEVWESMRQDHHDS